jgi:hypothetical protein
VTTTGSAATRTGDRGTLSCGARDREFGAAQSRDCDGHH